MDLREHWHLRKEVSVTTLIGLIVNLVVVVGVFVRMDTRIEWLERQQATDARLSVMEQHMRSVERDITTLDSRTSQSLDEIKQILREMSRTQDQKR